MEEEEDRSALATVPRPVDTEVVESAAVTEPQVEEESAADMEPPVVVEESAVAMEHQVVEVV